MTTSFFITHYISQRWLHYTVVTNNLLALPKKSLFLPIYQHKQGCSAHRINQGPRLMESSSPHTLSWSLRPKRAQWWIVHSSENFYLEVTHVTTTHNSLEKQIMWPKLTLLKVVRIIQPHAQENWLKILQNLDMKL